ncbi:hypothetical protein SUNI508_03043 [Seiridium unicorne]|uniref:RTA1 domain protein n=1 Tax=Seiridium unicorne TaxID=138068 RepID=A0ABR2VFK4_9PEZI
MQAKNSCIRPLLELANYHVLGRTLYYIPYLSPIHPGRVLVTFGALSSIVEALNAIGVSYSANTYLPERYIVLGHALMKASLIVQLVVIALFALLGSVFYHRCHKNGVLSRKVRIPLNTLSVSMGLILARTIYRTTEYFVIASTSTASIASVNDLSPLLRHEWYFWVFEAVLMLVNSVVWNVWHPGRYLPADKNIYLTQDGVTETEGVEFKDERSFLVTLLDPFGMCIQRGGKQVNGSAK